MSCQRNYMHKYIIFYIFILSSACLINRARLLSLVKTQPLHVSDLDIYNYSPSYCTVFRGGDAGLCGLRQEPSSRV